jgi:hypothetical protein
MNYDVLVSFAGYVGSEQLYSVDANDEDEAIDLAIDEAADDLSSEETINQGDGEWLVEINFAGLAGITESYEVYGPSEDDAIEAALELAKDDLSGEIN